MKSKIKRDRKVGKGFDIEKLAKIWSVLSENGTWIHVAEISRISHIDECTIRWYLDHYLKDAIEEEKIVPTIRLRMIRLKPGVELESYIKALNYINKIRNDNKSVKR
jgi:response regulator of citrate/malate metabolism